MTIQDILNFVFGALLVLDSGFWLLYLRAARNTTRRRVMRRTSLAVIGCILMVSALDLTIADRWQWQVPDGFMIPAMFLLVCLNTIAVGTLLFALSEFIRPSG